MKTKVGVFFGGKATEHEVSVISALQAIENMDRSKYEPIPIYITKNEDFYTGEELLKAEAYKDLKALLSKAVRVTITKDEKTSQAILYKVPIGIFPKKIGALDVAFPILHGNKGENGSIQGFFEMLSIPYVGSPVCASAIGMDKAAAKTLVAEVGIPVVKGFAIRKYHYYDNEALVLDNVEKRIGYPLIIKPASGGSSIGVEMADNRDELKNAFETGFSLDMKVIVEQRLQRIREVNCSVVGDAMEAKASVVEEPVATTELLSFEDKYMNDSTKGMSSAKREIPAKISDELTESIRAYSIRIFNQIGCEGVVRIDYMIDTETQTVYFNEINTIPGSLSFYLWKHMDTSYSKLLDDLITRAFKTHKRKEEINYSFDNNLFSSNNLSNMKGLKGTKN